MASRVAVETTNRAISIFDFARATTTPFALNTVGASQGPRWSPDGVHILYRGTRSGFRNLYWKSVDGDGEEERLTTSENGQTPGSFSPDGKWLAYSEERSQNIGRYPAVASRGERKPQVLLNTTAAETDPSIFT